MRTPRTLPAVVLVVLALAGCTFVAPGSAPTATGEPAAKVIDESAVIAALGPVPPDTELTDEVLDDYIVRWLDWQWAQVAKSYPAAVRPDVAEIERVTGSNPGTAACLDEAAGTAALEFAIASYTCSAEYPSLPTGTLSPDQARYLYDYWTGFVMPCYAAAGFADASTPPTREFFAANWPFQNWSPQPMRGGEHLTGPALDTVTANCPGMPAELAG